jgi:hypothetical protein
MPEIEHAVQFALAQAGKPYRAYGDRFGPNHYDCSGLVIRSLDEARVPLPPGISVESQWGNTVSLYNWMSQVGGLVSVQKAIATRGAMLIRGRTWGNGPLGHVSFSLGDGRQMAARGYRTGVGISYIDQGFYHDGGVIPGVHYRALDPPVDPDALAYLAALKKWRESFNGERTADGKHGYLMRGDTNSRVTMMNKLLILRAYMGPGRQSNTYTRYSQAAVTHLKRYAGLEGKGEKFGADAADALLKLG